MKIGDKVRFKREIDGSPKEILGKEGIVKDVDEWAVIIHVDDYDMYISKLHLKDYLEFSQYEPKHAKELDAYVEQNYNERIIVDDTKETVNHPSHYSKGIETIDYIESWGMNFNRGNIIKYVTRSPYKGKELEDLKKARFYLDREIEKLEVTND